MAERPKSRRAPNEASHQSEACRDIVVIGASAGGVETLKTIASGLPPNLPAAVFVVLHIQRSASHLPEILELAGPLPARHPEDGDKIEPGHIYVAPSDQHLLVMPGHIHLSRGPKENRNRPAANPLFRSASLAYGPRVIGVVLTGLLDDGTLGLWEIKRRGGLAIVQDPADSHFPQMPNSALENVQVDYSVPAREIAGLLVSLTSASISHKTTARESRMRPEPTKYTCPECHGPIERVKHESVTEYRCIVGHTYSSRSILEAHEDAEERACWTAIEYLEEGANLVEEVSKAIEPKEQTRRLHMIAEKRNIAGRLREMITRAESRLPKPAA